MAMAGIKHNFHFPKRENTTIKRDHRNLNFRQQLLLRSHTDEFRLKRFDPAFYTNTHISNVLSYELQGTFYVNRFKLDFGAEERLEQLNSSNLGQRERQYQSAYAQAAGSIYGLRVSTGLLVFAYNWQNVQLMPSLQLGKVLVNRHYIFANYSRGNRVPSWTEMFYTDPSNVGNPNLLPEFSHATELGWRQTPEYSDGTWLQFQAEAALFYRQHTNMIDWVRDASPVNPNPNPWTPVNIASVAFTGFESSVSLSLKKKSTWGPKKLNVNYTYITAQHHFTNAQESRYAITSMRHQLNGLAQFDLGEKVQLNFTYRLVQRIEQPLYQVIDAKLNLPVIRNWTIFIEANNLSNTKYVEAGFVQMPGRWFKFGLTFGHRAIENPRP